MEIFYKVVSAMNTWKLIGALYLFYSMYTILKGGLKEAIRFSSFFIDRITIILIT